MQLTKAPLRVRPSAPPPGTRTRSHGAPGRPRPSERLVKRILIALGALFALFALIYLLVPVPDVKASAVAQVNVYLYDDGSELGRGGDTTRQPVTLDQVPENVQHAVIAAENRTFYRDAGVSPSGIVRALLNDVTGGERQGGSTITQQYVKNAMLSQEPTLTRKVKEFFIALKLDRQQSKDEILTGYLNTIYFGRGAYGIQAAAQAYFGVDADRLTLGQGAYLAAALNAPGVYEKAPYNPEIDQRLRNRWNYVLGGMVESGWLSQAERDATQYPTPVEYTGSMNGPTGYLMQAADEYLVRNNVLSPDELDNGGYVIQTTFNRAAQEIATRAVENFRSGLNPTARDADRNAHVALASVVPGDGAVKALYGGPDYARQPYNDATRATVQAGSTFKAFTLAAALRDGIDGRPVSPDSYFDGNSNQTFTYDGQTYTISNEDGVDYGPISVRRAAQVSSNTVFVKLATEVGPDKVQQAIVDAGIPEDTGGLTPTPSITLGVASPTPLQIANAYATFAAHGERAEPYMVTSLQQDGEKIDLPERKSPEQAFDPNVADTVTDVLRGVVEGGTGSAAQGIGRPAAGKTGTTDDNNSALFVGYTPQLSTAVVLFGQDEAGNPASLYGLLGGGRVNGGSYPTQIWTQYMSGALAGQPVLDFPYPEPIGVVHNDVPPPVEPQDDGYDDGSDDEGSDEDEDDPAEEESSEDDDE